MYNGVYPDYLYHHGILGMKWGKRNGPPYPLAPSDHSASERKAGWRQSLDGGTKKVKEGVSRAAGAARSAASNVKRGLQTPEGRKKALKVGLALAGTALAVYGAVKVNQAYRDKKTELGRDYMTKHGAEMTRILNDIGRSSGMNSDEAAEYAGRATRDYLAPEAERYASRNAASALARDAVGAVRTGARNASNAARSAAEKALNVAGRPKKAYDEKSSELASRYYSENYRDVFDALAKAGRESGMSETEATSYAARAANDYLNSEGARYGRRNAGRALASDAAGNIRSAAGRVAASASRGASELRKAAGRTAERAGVAVRGAASRAIDRQNERAEARRQAGVELSSRAADYASRAGRDYQPGRDERRLATLERAERVGSAVARVTSPLRNAARAVGSAASSARNSELGKAAGRTAERAGVAARKAASNAIDRSNERARQREVDRQAAAVERERKRQEREARRRR